MSSSAKNVFLFVLRLCPRLGGTRVLDIVVFCVSVANSILITVVAIGSMRNVRNVGNLQVKAFLFFFVKISQRSCRKRRNNSEKWRECYCEHVGLIIDFRDGRF